MYVEEVSATKYKWRPKYWNNKALFIKNASFSHKKKQQTNEDHIFDSMVAVSSYTYARP